MWTDEFVLQDDIQQGISEGMVKWATDFYKNKSVNGRFELDVKPTYPLTMKSAAKYVLVKSGGVNPDLRSFDELVPAEMKEYERLDKAIQEEKKKQEDLQKRQDLVMQLVQSIEGQRDDLYQRLDISADDQEKAQIRAELVRVRQDKASAMASWKRLGQAIGSSGAVLDRLYYARYSVVGNIKDRTSGPSGDRMLRLQMALRYAVDGIGSETRINVIFCKAKLSSRKDPAVAETRGELDDVLQVLPGQFLLWPYQYILINLMRGRRKALAHEVIHLPWRGHPEAQVFFKGFKKLPLLGISLPEFEEVPGGKLDGPESDIMNYTHKDPEAKDTTMRAWDQERLEVYMKLLRKGEADDVTPPWPHNMPT